MLIHVVADYGTGDLAFAEVVQRLTHELPSAQVVGLSVPAFDGVAAGFCVAQLALTDGPPDRVVYCNVAPRRDDDAPRDTNQGERLLAARLANGVLVVGVDSPGVFAFVATEAEDVREVILPASTSQFRSRDDFPPLLAALVRGDGDVLGADVAASTLGPPPEDVVVYVDGYGNLKTSCMSAPYRSGTRVRVEVAGRSLDAVVSDGTFAVAAGATSFAPGSSGWRRRDGTDLTFYEVLTRGGSAAEQFGRPASGTRVTVTPLT